MIARLRSQRGFTLVELLVAISVGSVVMLATFSMLDTSVTLTDKTTKRVDATQRGRLAMYQITRALGSQVCPNATTSAIVGSGTAGQVASDQYQVDFWMFTGSTGFTPERHVIRWDTNTNSIIETVYNQAGTQTKQRTLLSKVRPTGSSAPVFTYFAYPTTSATFPTSQLESGGAALTAAEAATVALVKVSFTAQPDTTASSASTTSTPPQSQVFSDQVFVRTADPNDPKGPQAPLCA